MFVEKGSEILKLPPVRNCFTLTMTNKLVVIISSLKYQKLRFHYMKWNCLYQITAASRTPDYGAAAPRSPISLSFVLNWIYWTPPRTKFLGTPLSPVLPVIADEVYGKPMSLEPVLASVSDNTFRWEMIRCSLLGELV